MKRGVVMIALAMVAGGAGPALADSHMNFHNSTTLPDGSRVAVTGTFRTDVDTNADGTVSAFNEGTVEIELEPSPGSGAGSPDHFRVTARVATGDIAPCVMPASVLMGLGLVTPDTVQRVMGFTPTIKELRGLANPPPGDTIQRVTGLLIAEANNLNPTGAAAAARLAAIALGTTPPPIGDSVCLPETAATSTP